MTFDLAMLSHNNSGHPEFYLTRFDLHLYSCYKLIEDFDDG
jgi:hypothetical protein